MPPDPPVELIARDEPPAPSAQTCGAPSGCPAGFCDPFPSELAAYVHQARNWFWIRAGISAAVDSRVLPLWDDHVSGGTSTQNLTSSFGADFAASPTTTSTSRFLLGELESALTTSPPTVAEGSTVTVDIPATIPAAVSAIDDPADSDRMNFNVISDIPGNIAGDIGRDQLSCQSGKQPSPHNDERNVTGAADVTRTSATTLQVTPSLDYEVKDTIDLCPGNCGSSLEQIATVPMSQWEATGISGDVPITVEFSPSLTAFDVTAPASP